MDLKYFILTIVLATIEINVIESRQSEKRRWKSEKTHSHYVNVCDIQDRVSKIHCYCESVKLKTATRADCWVFNGGIAEDDPFWSNFYSQPKLERLSFNVRADGGLTYVPSKVIIRLDRLQYINIQYANIYGIQSFAFTNSTTLREILLSKNKIIKLERMAFAHMIMLTNVSLVDNQIAELKRDVFYVLPNLQRLHLSKNSISVIHDGCFKHLNNLVELNLDSNLLTVVIRENFQGLSNLMTLDMRNNKLTMIGDLAFAELWNLQELYLDENEIEFISERGFGGLTQLKKLSLAGNKLASITDGVLVEVGQLMLLDLRNNLLETLRQETVQNVLNNMRSTYATIALDGNKLICDCRLSWLHQLRNETKSKRLMASLDRLNCIMDSNDNTKSTIGNNLNIRKTIISNNKNDAKNKVFVNRDIDEVIDEFDDELSGDKSYEDTMQDQEPIIVGNKAEYLRKFLEIPKDLVPCSRSLLDPDSSFFPPTQDEVKYYKSSSQRITSTIKVSVLIIYINLIL